MKVIDGDEKALLKSALDGHREVVLWKLTGLSDDEVRRAVVPSGTSLLGLVKHLAVVEFDWFCNTFGRPSEPLPDVDADPDADFTLLPEETTETVVAFYRRAIIAADAAITELSLDATGTAWFGEDVTLRWVLIHMVEETARHAGHADLARELIDGQVGYREPGDV